MVGGVSNESETTEEIKKAFKFPCVPGDVLSRFGVPTHLLPQNSLILQTNNFHKIPGQLF